MRDICLVIKAEIIKQQHHNYHSYFVYFSLLLWPILGFLEIYYTYHPFEFSGYLGINNSQDLLAFLATGYMTYTCFWSMVQNAWSMSYQEREGGTLEIAFLTPANRMAMNYGKALGALIQEVWMFSCFCIFILFYTDTFSLSNLYLLPICLSLLVIASTLWGGMLNAVFLFSRDSSLIMDFLDTPMNLFSGAKIPIQCFPLWAKVISLIFPLTYCLQIIRLILGIEQQDTTIGTSLLGLVVCFIIMIFLTAVVTFRVEKHNRETGELNFF